MTQSLGNWQYSFDFYLQLHRSLTPLYMIYKPLSIGNLRCYIQVFLELMVIEQQTSLKLKHDRQLDQQMKKVSSVKNRS